MAKVEKVKASVKSAIQRKSAYSLPDNPIESGYKADDIRKALYKPIIDDDNSAISEIDRVVDEINKTLEEIPKTVILQEMGASTDKVMSQKAVSDELNKKSTATNLENGEGEGALQQKDFIFREMGEPGGRAYGAGSQSFGRAAKSYQCASFAAGNTVQSGMTEAEFNAYYWDRENNKPLHNGKGKDADGNILDATGYKYSESYAATATFGENNKSIGRALFTAGQSNRNIGSCNSVGGKTNNVYGIVDIVHGESTDVTGDNNSIFANNSDIKSNNVFAAGNALTGNYDNQILLGKLNKNSSNNILEVGSGEPILREVVFTVTLAAGDRLVIKPYYPSKSCAICVAEYYDSNHNTLYDIVGRIILSREQYLGTETINGKDYTFVYNVYSSNPLVISPNVYASSFSITLKCFALQDKSTTGNYQNFGVYVRHNGIDTYKADILNSYVNSQKNAFEILWDGRAKIKTAPKDSDDIVRLKELNSVSGGGGKLYQHQILVDVQQFPGGGQVTFNVVTTNNTSFNSDTFSSFIGQKDITFYGWANSVMVNGTSFNGACIISFFFAGENKCYTSGQIPYTYENVVKIISLDTEYADFSFVSDTVTEL